MIIFHLDGLSFLKLILTVLVWVSFGIAFISYFKKYNVLKKGVPPAPFLILGLLILWNLISVLRSLYSDNASLLTVFGNVYTSLALLIPFVVIFSINKFSVKVIQDYFIILLKIGGIAFLIFFVFSRGTLNTTQILILLLLLQPVVFLITLLPYQKKKNTLIILVCGVILFYVASLYSMRAMAIRQILLVVCLLAIYLRGKYNWKWVIPFSFLALLLPFILVQQSVATGESAIKKYLSQSSNDELSVDTRTFVYRELFEDLVTNNRLLVGKGATGRYYSAYFSTQEGDSDSRIAIEVGVLGMLLKGGLIAVVLNLTLLVIAIYYAFFKSKNYYVPGVGFVLLVHFVLLFIENVIIYSSYNFWIWFFIGICLSKQIRHMSNFEIYSILNKNPK
jgi:hypothetical protein